MTEVIAIDGPVGVGKSSVASRLAAALGWQHLDTGAMYRAVALKALQCGASPSDETACADLAHSMRLEFRPMEGGQQVILDGEDVTEAIRAPEVTEAVSEIADLRGVREELGRRQRELGAGAPSVAEGRDMGTVVFPSARWKFYLDAAPQERARRRGAQLRDEGNPVQEAALLEAIAERDRRDRERPVGALKIARDAIVVDTTGMNLDRVVSVLMGVVSAP
ncbi:(d)CMP kinase [Candidatus Sumerlaeota bacterium]|nr:(d)CMP kinase [Candidatus Sumerlaeota bacterium]